MLNSPPISDRTRPYTKGHEPGAFVILAKDRLVQGVYHHIAQTHIWDDALRIAGLMRKDDPHTTIIIETAWEVK